MYVLFYKKKLKTSWTWTSSISKLFSKIPLLPSKFEAGKKNCCSKTKDSPTDETVHVQKQSSFNYWNKCPHDKGISTSPSQRSLSVPQPIEHNLKGQKETTPYCVLMNTLPSSDPMNVTKQVASMSIQGTSTMYHATGCDLAKSKQCMIEDILYDCAKYNCQVCIHPCMYISTKLRYV